MKTLVLLPILCLCYFLSSAQTTLYVDSSVTASGAGTTWSSAYKYLNDALNTANAGSSSTKYEIRVARGTYFPTRIQNVVIHPDSTFFIGRGGVKIYGGYPSGGGTRSVTANPTVLNGLVNTASPVLHSYHVMVIAGITASADSIVVDGLEVTGGASVGISSKTFNGVSVSQNSGGGICGQNVLNGKFIISNCKVFGNAANGSGGGLSLLSCMPVITNCLVYGNTAGSGAGLFSTGQTVSPYNTTITNCSFLNNTASLDYGGATVQENVVGAVPPQVVNCSFSGNYAGGQGGGLYCSGASGGLVRGCTFTSNYAHGFGGGARCAVKKIDSCVFIGNRSDSSGGGLYNGCDTMLSCSFSQDTAIYGGAFYGIKRYIHSCTITGNRAMYGGGAYLIGGNLTSPVLNCSFKANEATNTGGGIYIKNGTGLAISGCLITGNRAIQNGGGIANENSANTIVNCTITGNSAVLGNGIFSFSSSSANYLNCIVWNGATNSIVDSSKDDTLQYCIVQGGWVGNGNFSYNPLFVTPLAASSAPSGGGDFHLTACSPAIDAGLANSYTGTKDLDGNNRTYGGFIDLGAYEYQSAGLLPQITGNTNICIYNTSQLSVSTSGGVWASSDTTVARINAGGLVTPVTGGTAVITYTPSGGPCSGPVTKVVTVRNVSVDPITGNTALCVGHPITLGNMTPGGVWSNSQAGITSINSTGVLTAIANGRDTVIYTVTDPFGCVGKSIYAVYVASCADSVWPGDANFDKIVNHKDPLTIAISMAATGPSRDILASNWAPQRCVDWSKSLPGIPGVNAKHADCNGDGVVSFADATINVNMNYGLTHPRQFHIPANKTAALPDLYFDFAGIAMLSGTQVTVPIRLGNKAFPMPRIAGLAARLMLDGLLPTDTPKITYEGSWLGNTSNTMRFARVISRSRTDWSYARFDHQSAQGTDTLALMTFNIPSGSDGQKMIFYFEDVLVVDSAGNAFSQYNVVDDTVTIGAAAALNSVSSEMITMRVLPNPSVEGKSNLQFTVIKPARYTIRISDMSGKTIQEFVSDATQRLQTVKLPNQNLAAGVYIITVETERKVAGRIKWTVF